MGEGVERESLTARAIISYVLGVLGPILILLGALDSAGVLSLEGMGALCIAMGSMLYLMHLAEAIGCSKTSSYLRNIMTEADFIKYIKDVQEADPRLDFSIQCYHYETRTETRTDANGKTHTTTKQVRVNTHHASMSYEIRGSVDETLSPAQMFAMFHLLHDGCADPSDVEAGAGKASKTKVSTLFLLCHMPLRLCPVAQEDEAHVEQTRSHFFAANTRDTHQDKRTHESISSTLHSHVMVVLRGDETDSTDRPWWMSCWFYTLCTVFLMSVPFRLFFFSKCQKTEWTVLKHFSQRPRSQWSAESPLQSRARGSDPASRAFRQVPRETASVEQTVEGTTVNVRSACQDPEVWGDGQIKLALNLPEEAPMYWRNRDLAATFDEKVKLPDPLIPKFQELVDMTFKNKATRDRKDGPMPARLVVKQVLRMEDSKLWKTYLAKRMELANGPMPRLIHEHPGSGRFKTAPAEPQDNLPDSLKDLCSEINEAYLFHGSSPMGALGIGEDGFDMGMVGSHVGTMFGAGAYFAEASSKSDEYASEDPSGVFKGKYAFLLCRVLVGNAFYITESDVPRIEEALATKRYHSVLGDREAEVGTYREIVVFDQAQIYPEFVVIYERSF